MSNLKQNQRATSFAEKMRRERLQVKDAADRMMNVMVGLAPDQAIRAIASTVAPVLSQVPNPLMRQALAGRFFMYVGDALDMVEKAMFEGLMAGQKKGPSADGPLAPTSSNTDATDAPPQGDAAPDSQLGLQLEPPTSA